MELQDIIQPESVLEMVQKRLKIKDLTQKGRRRDVYQGRFIYFKLAKNYCRYASLTKIGRVVKREHATVINGLNKYDMEAKYDPYMQDVYDHIASQLDKKYIKPGKKDNIDFTFDKLLDKVYKLEDKINKLGL
jgi:chromosomal replication initiation ATPase DnaA